MNRSRRDVEMEFPTFVKGIIATKGLPCTWKTTIARRMGDWTECPVLNIDHFLDALSVLKGYNAESRPTEEEGKNINRVAIEALWKAAARNLDEEYGSDCVVVKSSLATSFELDLLAKLAYKLCQLGNMTKVIVIDCQMKNEHRYRLKMERRVSLSEHLDWCKASSWNDIVKAREADDCLLDDDHAWDQHIGDLFNGVDFRGEWEIEFGFVRLVVDAYEDISLYEDRSLVLELRSDFREAIRYLLTRRDSKQYEVVQLGELRRFLMERKLRKPRARSDYLCATNGRDNCLFKYWEDLTIANLEYDNCNCGVCEERIVISQPAYTCHFCFLALHKSCAERLGNESRSLWANPLVPPPSYLCYTSQLSRRTVEHHPCKSCVEGGKPFSYKCHSCLFQTHLKANMLPTIIHHDSHTEHFLSIQFPINNNVCKACGTLQQDSGYACNVCKFYCHVKCIFFNEKFPAHQHGGYKHDMKLVFSHDGMEHEESYWCDKCYEDLDPQHWFYICTHCPYYVTHTQCPRDILKGYICNA